ncbi:MULTISPECIES: 23S rRNA (adenine(2503)-C(2))-methyltransferase RlmN [Clostridium]|uniref:Probable dual-specificity RNA methyltransferase RlmN n=1 Tax=Clostridium novyi (strain NT) TaxID=386415 RepID=RLMN_CLONN|nr:MULTISPECIES: 23S rRNA (adenine(2503)-C(2))-methyltransferase RlmN [Clostridium]A0Q112.1 RecName: Full=Probable dual-specificity RNA methyltransferase RlmN; AltName: Full=23S rRNA (adenine(2503)-C(2))-methyltransferase; AltName: Full=23S rRNA m2A2503 methyltransferase; AltName: Full=Ribosomal RNA large subunit methyltransferase N; AltName: Full=tRNA (adenine(37)-C(2))-methyltransferase; AltName: Full=tRNA m2A37 methyltransferase [Clostridium novyi NT]ABK61723.1 radical SAM enzyme, Cfr family [
MKNILNFTLDELKDWMDKNSESKFRAKQIFQWIYKKAVFNFDDMSNISKSTKEKLKENFYIQIPNVVKKYVSNIDGTEKFLFEYEDGNIIESVVMKYKHGNSICVSTQIGCRMGCKFCASTVDGVVRNLTSGEIIAQVLKAQKEICDRISNVVLMGSGEPLDNYDNVIKFLKLINDEDALNIGQRHITLSTCGIVPKIKELADQKMQITLAISLHAPNNEIRKSMMPIANKYTLEELLDACRYYYRTTNRRITFEYALVKGVNDSRENAEELIKISKGMLCHINLIPVNEIKENNYERSKSKDIEEFKETLIKHGIETTIRREMGSDINGACGQLRRNYIRNN